MPYIPQAVVQSGSGALVWTDYVPTLVGWAATPTVEARYLLLGTGCLVTLFVTGTSNSATTTATLPFTANSVNSVQGASLFSNNGASVIGRYYFQDTSTIKFGISATSDTWTGSGLKIIGVNFWYPL